MISQLDSRLSYMSEGIIEQIVARVQCIRTIIRWTSVCKSWNSFIKSTRFVKFHLSVINNFDSNKKFLLFKHNEDILSIEDDYHDYDDSEEEEPKSIFFTLHEDSEKLKEYYRFSSLHIPARAHACNGLICYNTDDDPHSLYLWNPIIQKVKKLSNPIPNLNNAYIPPRVVFKLWFDSEVNNYKILRIVYTTKTPTIDVYSLDTDSWKLITDNAPVGTCKNIENLVYVNGSFYWPLLMDHKWLLISLDTKNWKFQEKLTRWQGEYIYLIPSKHDDSLGIIGYSRPEEDLLFDPYTDDVTFGICSFFEVYNYTMDKMYSVGIGDDRLRLYPHLPLGIRHNGDLLLQDIYEIEIFTYNMKNKKLIELDPKKVYRFLQVTPFVQTLALLDDADAYKQP